jgi:hypothetical protein
MSDMDIDIAIREMTDAAGRVCSVDVKSTIMYSPREGFNADKIAGLERDIGLFVKERLNSAIERGGAA